MFYSAFLRKVISFPGQPIRAHLDVNTTSRAFDLWSGEKRVVSSVTNVASTDVFACLNLHINDK